MNLVPNEQIKLTATCLNNLALAFAVAGFVAPLVGLSFGMPNAPAATLGSVVISLTWLLAAGLLHFLARRVLRSLTP